MNKKIKFEKLKNGDWDILITKQFPEAGWHEYSADNLKVTGKFLDDIEKLIDKYQLDLEQEVQLKK
jgi:hypothetical protein